MEYSRFDRRTSVRSFLLVCSVATFSAILLIAWTYVVRIARGRAPTDGLSPVYWELSGASLWILLFPLIYYIVCRNPLVHHGVTEATEVNRESFFLRDLRGSVVRKSGIKSLVAIHIGFALLFSAFHMVFNILLAGFLYNAAGFSIHTTNPWCPWLSSLRMSWRILLYFLIVAVCYLLEFYHGVKAARIENSALQNRLKKIRLEQLRIQIDSNFVQRTLSDVYRLMHSNTTAAIETITRLGAFFRLIQKQETEVTLRQRIQILKSYFRVEAERSEGTIRARMRIDRNISNKRIPGFILQPILDKFCQTRISGSEGVYRLRIRIKKMNRGVRMILKDNLPWSEDLRELIAELETTIGTSHIRSKTYRVRAKHNSIQILFTPRPSSVPYVPAQDSRTHFRIVAWSGLALLVGMFLFARQTVLLFASSNDFTWQQVANLNTGWILYGLATPVILWLAKKVDLHGAKSIVLHSTFSLSLTVVFIIFHALLLSGQTPHLTWKNIFLNSSRASSFPDQILMYWAILLLANSHSSYRKYFLERSRSDQLQSDLSNAQLKALEMQLHPHFLFNTLHAINGLILTDKAVAARMLTRLQYFLQMTLCSSNQHLVPLKQELKFLDCYLDIQKIRFGNRLNVRMEIDPKTLLLPVPQLILQPIVENAIRHGIAHKSKGEIVLYASRDNGTLRISVQDNGPGLLDDNTETRKGVGLQNSALRLHHLYGASQKFLYGNRFEGGFEVKMEIPA